MKRKTLFNQQKARNVLFAQYMLLQKRQMEVNVSKQSNQRYRKEKEKEHLKREGIETKSSVSSDNNEIRDKINREFTSSDKTDR